MLSFTNATKIYINGSPAEGEGVVEHKEGQVMLLDFWATWCPPCQGPMAHNQHMLESRGKDWGENVRLVGLSIDSAAATVKNHVESKKWTNVEHWWIRNGKCQDDEAYNFRGVPHVALVDKSGTIVFKGHPANRPNLEADIDALLKGETLKGVQAPSASGKFSESPLPAGDSWEETQPKIQGFNSEAKKFMEEHADKFKQF